jgi:uncharacterized membrane protein
VDGIALATPLGFAATENIMSTHQFLLALHLLVIALGIGFTASNFINARLALGQTGDMAKGLGLHRATIARFGDVVIALIWITGGLLIWQRGGMAGLPPAFHVKLLFVILLTVFHGLGRMTAGKMRREGNMAALPRLGWFILGGWVSAVVALVCAVLAFAA